MMTPWGEADTVEQIAVGIMKVTTPGHGGYHLDSKQQAKVPDYMRTPDAWYEEDDEWAIVATVFPEYFSEATRAIAKTTLERYHLNAYAHFYPND